MPKRTWVPIVAAALLVAGIVVYSYQRWKTGSRGDRSELLAIMPNDASAVIYADLAELRHSPFTAQLYKWAPRQQVDPDYAQFLGDTGFDYERDLDRLVIAVMKRGQDTSLFAVADGRFDQKKIVAYASKSGARESDGVQEVLSVRLSGSSHKISFSFIGKNRISLTDNADIAQLRRTKKEDADSEEWRKRFERLAGSPVFAVIRQDAGVGGALASQAPGGLQSPQLSALLDQLQWITLAGKPEADRLRVVAEGETSVDNTARQLSELLNGVLILAQAGLNGRQLRQQLDQGARQAYLEMLKGAEVSRIDRGETKSVRVMFDLTPKFLEAARVAPSAGPVPASPPKNHDAQAQNGKAKAKK